jgi:predicted metal-dependent phosphoesterase TrpH
VTPEAVNRAGVAGKSFLDSARRIKADLHVHTRYSEDSLMTLDEVVEAALARGLGAVAITDHDAIEGALALSRMAPFPVIVGEEVDVGDGEIIGLFLQELIPPELGAVETIARIRAQGGLVYIPHPFDSHRYPLPEAVLRSLLHEVDAIEVLNARVTMAAFNERAARFAQDHAIPCGAGSDAHTPGEIGRAYVEMEPFVGRDSFLTSLARGRIGGHESGRHVHLFSTWAKIRKRTGAIRE